MGEPGVPIRLCFAGVRSLSDILLAMNSGFYDGISVNARRQVIVRDYRS